MKRWLLVFCAFLCAGSFVSCGVQRYRVDSASRVVDTAGTFRNDRLGLSFYFGSFYTQHGSCPLDRAAARMLAACEIDPKTDTVLFGGGMMFCVLRYSRPSYLNETKKHPLSWEHHRNCSVYPLLDTVQNRPSGFVAEQKCLFSNENLRKYCTPEEIELLTTSSFTRKVKVCKRAKTVLIEDLIPWKGHAVSMIYVLKMWNGKDWDEFQTWKGGGHLSDPSAPDNMMSDWRRPQSDFDLRLTRENGMRMKLPSRIPEQPE